MWSTRAPSPMASTRLIEAHVAARAATSKAAKEYYDRYELGADAAGYAAMDVLAAVERAAKETP